VEREASIKKEKQWVQEVKNEYKMLFGKVNFYPISLRGFFRQVGENFLGNKLTKIIKHS